jgi:hypothetical protein
MSGKLKNRQGRGLGGRAMNTFILGAGFSKNFNIPLTNELLKNIVVYCSDKEEYSNFKKKLDYYLNRLIHLNNKKNNNGYFVYGGIDIEDFLSMLDMLIHLEYKNKKNESKALKFKNDLLIILREYFKTLKNNITNIDILKRFLLDIVDEGNQIITLNWDTLIEDHCDILKYGKSNDYYIGYLKLHGSIDWVCNNEPIDNDCIRYTITYDNQKDAKYKALDMQKINNDELKKISPPCIIYPTTYKKYGFFSHPFGTIWQQLKQSKKIYIIGISMQKEEHLLRLLLRDSLAARNNNIEEIIIVNPDANNGLINRYNEFIGKGKLYKYIKSFLEFIRTHPINEIEE